MADMEWKGPELVKAAERVSADRLLQCAAMFVSELQAALSKSYPPASKEGEFPRWRTGTGRSSVSYAPAAIDAVMRRQAVDVGLRAPGMHLAILELLRRRQGFKEMLAKMKSRLEKVLGGS